MNSNIQIWAGMLHRNLRISLCRSISRNMTTAFV